MSFRTIIVHVGADSGAAERTAAAFELARRFGAAVIGIGAAGQELMVDLGPSLSDPSVAAALPEAARMELLVAEAVFRKAAELHPFDVGWRPRPFHLADHAVIEAAQCGDLIVLCREPAGGGRSRTHPGRLAVQAGVPVCLLEPSRPGPEPRTVVVGWADTPEARRAVSDALPFMRRARQVLIAGVARAERGIDIHRQMAHVQGRLARHGIAARCLIEAPGPGGTADDLLQLCRGHGADLLVAGAYGHSRLGEWAFGGVTADLVDHADLAVLFSH